MGVYFNPNNGSFRSDKLSKIYIDKTGLINFLNEVLGTNSRYIALSHARRFGKSHAAGMIDAYYSLGCDSSNLFDDTEIASSEDYRKYMNKYNVIHLDISSAWDFHKEDLIEFIHARLCEDFKKEYADKLDYSKDEALTALMHLGYLGYDADGEGKKRHTCVIEDVENLRNGCRAKPHEAGNI